MDEPRVQGPGSASEESSRETISGVTSPDVFLEPGRATSFAPGQLLLGRFRIVRCVGRGGMGEVYEAEDLELGRVALKTVLPNYAAIAAILQRFKQEIQLARKVSGPHVCRIFELFLMPPGSTGSAQAFLTMEFLEGETLSDRLHLGSLEWKMARRLALGICSGLEAIHRAGVLHRDLKSRNIMLARRDGVETAVLTDFGLAMPLTLSSGGRGEAPGAIVGTPQYMAPEQFEGGTLTPATDIYALGIVLFEMVNGKRPFDAETPLATVAKRAHMPRITNAPRGWREIINKCLEYEPPDRYQSAAEVAASLRRADNPVTYAADRTAKFAWRFRLALLAVAAMLVGWTAWTITARMRQHVPPAEARRWYDKGVAALQEATYLKAINALQMAVERDDKFAMAHARLAEAWNELDFTGTADHEMLLASRQAGSQRLTDQDKRQLAATQAVLARDYKEAIYQQSALLDNDDDGQKPGGLVDRGRTEEKAGDIPAALKDFERAAALAPDQPAAWVHVGILQGRLQHERDAKAAFARAENLYRAGSNQEGVAEVEYQQGYLANVQGRDAEARQHLDAALEQARQIDSKQLQIRVLGQLSAVASDDGDQKQAAAYARQAIDLADSNGLQAWSAGGLVRLADSYLRSGDPQLRVKAQQSFRDALRIAEQTQQPRIAAHANIGLANLAVSPDEAIKYATAALDYYRQFHFTEGTVAASILLARAQRDSGQFDAALKTSHELLAAAESSGSTYLLMQADDLAASTLMKQEDYPQARDMFGAAAALATPADRKSEQLLVASADIAAGDFGGADAILATGQQPPSVAAREVLAQEALTRGNLALVIKTVGPADSETLSDTLRDSGATAEARSGNAQAAAAFLQQLKPGTPADQAAFQMTAAEVALASGDAERALSSATAALKFYSERRCPESMVRAAWIAERAAKQLGRTEEAKKIGKIGLDTLRQVENTWSPSQYGSFVARPDIQAMSRQLELSQQ